MVARLSVSRAQVKLFPSEVSLTSQPLSSCRKQIKVNGSCANCVRASVLSPPHPKGQKSKQKIDGGFWEYAFYSFSYYVYDSTVSKLFRKLETD